MTTPTLINLPPPPSESVTPSDMGPGTPNSGTTSLSALSTTAIKDGHQGQPLPHHGHTHGHGHHSHGHAHRSSSTSMSSTNTLEAERADRISRLAGLERVATARAGNNNNNSQASMMANSSNNNNPALYSNPHPLASGGYFDSQQSHKERSTVGSASATGSIGGRTATTWASGSDAFEEEADSKASEDTMDDGTSSVGNASNASEEANASLVGFGEGASTISGPISRPNLNRVSSGGGGSGSGNGGGGARTPSSLSSPSMNASRANNNPLAAHLQATSDSPMAPSPSSPWPMSPSAASASLPPDQMAIPGAPVDDPRLLDGMTYDADVVDTTMRTPRLASFRPGSQQDSGSER